MKKIVVAVTGSIAAYKTAILVRLFKKSGCDVRVVMTKSAKEFITPMTMQALSGHPVVDDILDPAHEMGMGHIELSRWADAIIIAPCSANMMAKLANGIADDLVSAMCLASSRKIHIAPSMNRYMWDNPMTQANIHKLMTSGLYQMIAPDSGEQACGEVGQGRMAEPETIHARILLDVVHKQDLPLLNKKVVITGGPTREAIDPVRYLSNHSSGKMACALADAFAEQGADVILVLGPCETRPKQNVAIVYVESAQDMLDAVLTNVKDAAIFVGAAAVADYRVLNIADEKMKKDEEEVLTLSFVKNADILATVASLSNKPFVVGFAAETQNVIEYAMRKLQNKKLDLICANDVSAGKVFGKDENSIVIIDTNNEKVELSRSSKQNQAVQIVKLVINKLKIENNSIKNTTI